MIRRTPFDDFEEMMERMNRGFDEGLFQFRGERLPVDVSERGDELVVTADLPGYDREHIDVSVAGDRLTVAAEREAAREDSEASYLTRERRHESVSRTVTLPAEVDAETAHASYTNGVLTVRFPVESGEEHRIDVE
jgi:HSP20 family protein